MRRGTSMKGVRLKGVHTCSDSCTFSKDGAENHCEIVNGEELTFTIKMAPGLKASDPEMWELTRNEHIDKGRQTAYAAMADKRVAQDLAGYENLKAAFELFDEDCSGELDTSEILAILTRAGGGNAMSEEDAAKFIELFDHNGDGKMQYTEFIEAMKALAEASGLWEGQASAADEVVEAIVEDYGLSVVNRMDEDQVQKLEAAKEKLKRAKGAGVGHKIGTVKASKAESKPSAATLSGGASAAEDVACPVEGLREIMVGLSIGEHLAEASSWCTEVGLDSLAELKEAEMEADLVSYLVDLPDAKAKLMLKRIREAK